MSLCLIFSDLLFSLLLVVDSLVINIGDCLQHWSSNCLRSTRHRVSFPLKENSNSSSSGSEELDYEMERYSIAYFVSPNYDTVLRQSHRHLHQNNNNNNETKTTTIETTTEEREERDMTYSEWRKERIKQAMKALKKK